MSTRYYLSSIVQRIGRISFSSETLLSNNIISVRIQHIHYTITRIIFIHFQRHHFA